MSDSQVLNNSSDDTDSVNTDSVNTSKKSSSDLPSVLEDKIIRQIEYYFGDINLNKDKFLQEQIKSDDGWVTIDTLLKFNRLAYLSNDKGVIVDALDKSESGLMEISEDKTKVRRSPNKPIPEMNENKRKELMTRTVYCKGLPKDMTMNELLDFFQQFGKIDNVVMRNWQDKSKKAWFFKGSVFVVFPTIEEAESFLKLESVKHKDTDLIKMFQNDYIDFKRKERLEHKMNKKNKISESKEKKSETQPNGEKQCFVNKLPSCCVVHLTGLKENITRENIKSKIESFGFSVAYVDFSKGDEQGWVRLDEQDSAKEFVKKLEETNSKVVIDETEIEVTSLTEEEETKYLQKVREAVSKKKFAGKGKKKGKRGGGGKGDWNMRKRKASPTDDGPTPAKVKAEDNCE